MAASEEMSSLFPIFILSVMGLFIVPWTIYRIVKAFGRKTRSMHCHCSLCTKSPKYRTSMFAKASRFASWTNVVLIFMWIAMAFLVYYIRSMSGEIQLFEPFSILGLEPNASDADIKKAYRRLSIQYHPDKNPDPEANAYFVDFISKAYSALTDPVARENFAKYGHPDGRQGMKMGIALPQFLLNQGASGSVLLLSIVGIGILLPLLVAVIYLTRSSKYTGNYVMHHTMSNFYIMIKPSLAPSKVMDVLTHAAEFLEIPVRRSDDEPLQKIFLVVRSELNLDPKNLKQEQTKFWKRLPVLVKTELLLLAHLTREASSLPASLVPDFNRVLQITPRLLEELMKMAMASRGMDDRGWLRPAMGVIELSQCFFQAIPLSARKPSERSAEGIAPLLQLPHFNDNVVKKITRKKVRTLQEIRELKAEERKDLLTSMAGFSDAEAADVEEVLGMMPTISLDVTCETEGEEGIQEGDIVTMRAWVSLSRGTGLTAAHAHTPYFPHIKEEGYWLILGDVTANTVWVFQRVTFMDEAAALTAASKAVQESLEGTGADNAEVKAAVSEAVEKVKQGYRLVISKFRAHEEGIHNMTAFCLSDCWLGCDKKINLKLKIGKKRSVPAAVPAQRAITSEEGDVDGSEEDEIEEAGVEDDTESEYSSESEGSDHED